MIEECRLEIRNTEAAVLEKAKDTEKQQAEVRHFISNIFQVYMIELD